MNRKSFINLLCLVSLVLASKAQNPKTQVTMPKGCSNSQTEQNFQSTFPVENDKTIALIYGLSEITGSIKTFVSSNQKNEDLEKTDNYMGGFKSKIGDRLQLDVKSVREIFHGANQTKSETFLERTIVQFTYDNITYKLVTDLYEKDQNATTESLISANGEVILNLKTKNSETPTSEKNEEKLNQLFDRLTTYLTPLGCTVEVVDVETSASGQIEKQQYICLRADKEKFTANVKFENSKPK